MKFKIIKSIILTLFLPALLIGCKVASVGSEKSGYNQLESILKKSKITDADIEFLRDNYDKVNKQLLSDATKELQSDSRFKWRASLVIYRKLQIISDGLSKHQHEIDIAEVPATYHTKIKELEEAVAKDLYEQGTEALASNSRAGAKVAHFLFLEANQIMPEYEEVNALINESKEMASVTVYLHFQSKLEGSLSYDSLLSNIQTVLYTDGIAGPFVKFKPHDIDAEVSRAHLATISFDEIKLAEIEVKQFTQTVDSEPDKSIVFNIDEYTTDITLELTVDIVGLELNDEILLRPIKVKHGLSRLVGHYKGNHEDLNAYQLGLLENEPITNDMSNLLQTVNSETIKIVLNTLLEQYQNY